MKNIVIIAGDSWGCGEFIPHTNHIAHGGTAEYLRAKGLDVRNLSMPGGSNLDACERVKHYLAYNLTEVPKILTILFWQTEFYRDICFLNTSDKDKEIRLGYKTFRDRFIAKPYYELSSISQQWFIPVYVLGGSGDTSFYDDFDKDFPGVKIVCQSLVNYLIRGSTLIQRPVHAEFINGLIDEFLSIIKPYCSTQDLEQLIVDMDMGQHRMQQMASSPDLFWPDGIHPNRLAHKKIFELLLTTIPEFGGIAQLGEQ